MTDQKRPDPDRYALVIEGVRWEYNAKWHEDYPWFSNDAEFWQSRGTDYFVGIAPTHVPAILAIVAKWHEDRMPKMRRRVVQDTEGPHYYAVSLKGGLVWSSSSEAQARRWAAEGEEDLAAGDVATAIRMGKLYADLLANPDESEPTDES